MNRDMFRIYRGETESRASAAIRICVQKFKRVLKRKKGNGTRLTKVHQMLHSLQIELLTFSCSQTTFDANAGSIVTLSSRVDLVKVTSTVHDDIQISKI
eukprot:scaffold27074_cov32-Attheya_sp.AAC.1